MYFDRCAINFCLHEVLQTANVLLLKMTGLGGKPAAEFLAGKGLKSKLYGLDSSGS
jgi:hypothetical protein